MKLIFTRAATPLSWLIRANTQEPGYTISTGWSHVAIIVGDDHIVDAGFSRGVSTPRKLSSFLANNPNHQIIDIKCDDNAAELWLISQIGKRYDYEAYFGIAFYNMFDKDRNWQEEDKWFCSELAAACLVKGGVKFKEHARVITPIHLHRLCVNMSNSNVL
jgi:uncharacterized protein YycO